MKMNENNMESKKGLSHILSIPLSESKMEFVQFILGKNIVNIVLRNIRAYVIANFQEILNIPTLTEEERYFLKQFKKEYDTGGYNE